MVKSYFRYRFEGHFGVVSSPACNVILDPSGRTVFTAANEFVCQWNPLTGELLKKLSVRCVSPEGADDVASGYVTALCLHPLTPHVVAAGYSDGAIRLWDWEARSLTLTFHGHQTGVSTLEFSLDGHLLVSGGWDTDIVVWDVVSQSGLYRLRGHKNQVTALRFLHSRTQPVHVVADSPTQGVKTLLVSDKKRRRADDVSEEKNEGRRLAVTERDDPFIELSRTPEFLISGSKDGAVKVWDLSTQWCIQTLFNSSGEVWSLAVDASETQLIVGSVDHQLKVYSLSVPSTSSANAASPDMPMVAEYIGSITRPDGRGRVSQLICAVDVNVLATMLTTAFARTSYSTHPEQVLSERGLSCSALASEDPSTVVSRWGTLLTNESKHVASEHVGQILLAVCPTKRALEVYRMFTPKERIKKHLKRKRRATEKLKLKKKKLEGIQTLSQELQSQLGQNAGQRTALGTTYEAEMEAALQKLEELNAEVAALKKESTSLKPSVADQIQYIHTFHLHKKATSIDYNQSNWNMLSGFADGTLYFSTLPLDQLLLLKGPATRALLLQKPGEEITEAESQKTSGSTTIVDPEALTLVSKTQCAPSSGHTGAAPMGVAISHDDAIIATLSEKTLYLWNTDTMKSIHTISLDEQLLCCFFVAGNRHVVLATARGSLLVVDIVSCCVVERLPAAHAAAIRAMAEHPKKTGFATVSSDKSIRFFQFALQSSAVHGETISCKEIAQYDLLDEGLDVKFSPDSRVVAVSLLNFTIQVFYADTMKLFLTLYGHKLPCTSISISSDSTLLASGSSDKTIKIWGLDFGNIQKSWHAHNDGVTQVHFLKDTHYLVSAGKDNLIKLWDVDRRELMCQLAGHLKPITSLTTTRLDSDRIIAAGLDGSTRVWKRTDEQYFAEEEKEKLLERKLEQEAARPDLSLNGSVSMTAKEVVMSRATRRTVASIRSTEQLMEAIDLVYSSWNELENYKEALQTWISETSKRMTAKTVSNVSSSLASLAAGSKPIPPTPRIELMGMEPHHYLFTALAQLPTSLHYEVCVALPFSFAEKLLTLLGDIFQQLYVVEEEEKGGALGVHATETMARLTLLLVHLHMQQFIAFPSHRPCLLKLQKYIRPVLLKEKEKIEFNSVGIQHIQKIHANHFALS